MAVTCSMLAVIHSCSGDQDASNRRHGIHVLLASVWNVPGSEWSTANYQWVSSLLCASGCRKTCNRSLPVIKKPTFSVLKKKDCPIIYCNFLLSVTIFRFRKRHCISVYIRLGPRFVWCFVLHVLWYITWYTVCFYFSFYYINVIFFTCHWLAMSNSCLNPIIYGVYNES